MREEDDYNNANRHIGSKSGGDGGHLYRRPPLTEMWGTRQSSSLHCDFKLWTPYFYSLFGKKNSCFAYSKLESPAA